jgi:hypothetical protein
MFTFPIVLLIAIIVVGLAFTVVTIESNIEMRRMIKELSLCNMASDDESDFDGLR